MTILLTIFALMQAAGAVVGAGGSVFAELFYLRAIQDGKIDDSERAHMRVVASALRTGMLLLLAGSIGLVIINFVYLIPTPPALTYEYWIEMLLAFAVITASWLLSRHHVSFAVGSAAIFTGWWLIALLVFGRLPAMTLGAGIALYVVSTALIAIALTYARASVSARTA